MASPHTTAPQSPSPTTDSAPSSQPTSLEQDAEEGIPTQPFHDDDQAVTDDDVYTQEPNDGNPTTIEGSDIPRLRQTHTTAGYRDGIAFSKDKSRQPGFDEGYPLGATFGLRVGWVLGVLEGISAALGAAAKPGKKGGGRAEESDGIGRGVADWGKAFEESMGMLKRAREELKVEELFGREFWCEDGTWRYEVVRGDRKEGEVEGEVTFAEVVEQHPLLRRWVERTRGEMTRWGVREGVFEGEEWEKGRVREG